jgi:hypothetical protein
MVVVGSNCGSTYCLNCGWDTGKNAYKKKQTNFDRIKAMSVEEFARFAVTEPALAWDNYPEDYEDMLDWLNKEVE